MWNLTEISDSDSWRQLFFLSLRFLFFEFVFIFEFYTSFICMPPPIVSLFLWGAVINAIIKSIFDKIVLQGIHFRCASSLIQTIHKRWCVWYYFPYYSPPSIAGSLHLPQYGLVYWYGILMLRLVHSWNDIALLVTIKFENVDLLFKIFSGNLSHFPDILYLRSFALWNSNISISWFLFAINVRHSHLMVNFNSSDSILKGRNKGFVGWIRAF